MKRKTFITIAGATLLVFLIFGTAQSAWFDSNWHYRNAVTVSNSGSALTDYQVKITLDSSFDFTKAKSDGSDLRITASDETTLIPFWIENWNPPSSATIWVKVPSIPSGGTNMYLYYGNPAASFDPSQTQTVDLPPTGPWTNIVASNFGLPASILAENMVQDESGTYWQLFSDRRVCNAQLGFATNSTGNPANSSGWSWWGNISIDFSARSTNPRFSGDPRLDYTPGNLLNPYLDSPHVVKGDDGKWYLFYHWVVGGDPHGSCGVNGTWSWTPGAYRPIGVARANSVGGPYIEIDPFVLQPAVLEDPNCAPGLTTCGTHAWEWAGVSEPTVFKANIGGTDKWVMLYMGDRSNYDDQGNPNIYYIEQVSYAVADNITGPYTKWNGGATPAIAFGPPGSLDAGTIADPHPVKAGNTWYIFYAASPTTWGWSTMYATTTDWQTFTKSTSYLYTTDGNSPFRGAISRFGNTYYFPYLGSSASNPGPFQIATQPATGQVVVPGMNDPNAVFDFYDGFDGTVLDLNKWQMPGSGYAGTAVVNNGQLSICSTSDLMLLSGKSNFGVGYILESYARHIKAGSTIAAEIGFGRNEPRSNWNGPPFLFDRIAIMDLNAYGYTDFVADADNADHSEFSYQTPPGPDYVQMGILRDQAWHIHRITRVNDTTATFQLDNFSPTTILDTTGGHTDRVTSDPLAPWFFMVGGACMDADWVRVRKYISPEPGATIGQFLGQNVPVDSGNGTGLIFSQVTGVCTCASTTTPSNPYGPKPGYNFIGPVYDIYTSNCPNYTGPVTVTIPYDESLVPQGIMEGNLKMFHWNGATWVNVTTSMSTTLNSVTGQVSSLSPFVIGYPIPLGPSGPSTGANTYVIAALALLAIFTGVFFIKRRQRGQTER
jgi:LPXTG-motif cell wall-anchored protein